MDAKGFCQSCGMPMNPDMSLNGTEKDGSKNADYCSYCYKDGGFTWDCTMEEMIRQSAPHMAEANKGMTEEQACGKMREFFPMLKRWAQ